LRFCARGRTERVYYAGLPATGEAGQG